MECVPNAGNNFSNDSYFGEDAICKCGYISNTTQKKAEMRQQSKLIKIFIGTTIGLSIVLGQMMVWGPYLFTAPVLKLGETLGVLSSGGYEDLISICSERNRWTCAESAYQKICIEMAVGTRKLWRAGRISKCKLKSLSKPRKSTKPIIAMVATMLKFLMLTDKCFEELEVPQAQQYYQRSIEQNPGKLSVGATSGLVRILMKNGNYEQAREVLEQFFASAENAKGYMNMEWAQLEKILGPEKPKSKHVARR